MKQKIASLKDRTKRHIYKHRAKYAAGTTFVVTVLAYDAAAKQTMDNFVDSVRESADEPTELPEN